EEKTGEILPRSLYVEIPDERLRQVTATAQVLGATVYSEYPFHKGTAPVTQDISQALLNRTWRPQLEITGAAGLPPLDKSGNVLRPVTAAKVSLRLPHMVNAVAETALVKRLHVNEHHKMSTAVYEYVQCIQLRISTADAP